MKNYRKLITWMLIVTFTITALMPVKSFADTGSSTSPTIGTTDISKSASDLDAQIEELMKAIQQNYYKDVTVEDLKNGAIKGMFGALDKHSNYFTPDEFKAFSTDISGELIGIGVNVEKNASGGIKVVAPIQGSDAEKAGIKSGDIILQVDDKDITGYTLDQAVKIIRGEAGTKVKIGIRRGDASELQYFTITRKVITINPVNYKVMDGNIGYIRISQFNGHALENVTAAIESMKDKKVKGIIFDLRGNPGGLLNEVIQICQELIPAGPVVHIQQKGQITATYSSSLEKAPFKLVALVDGGSASAAEIMAGAIKDSGAGILVGDKTYGKGTVQQIYSGSNGMGYKITIANYLTPSKFSLDGIGLTPNITVKYNLEKYMNAYSPMSLKKTLKPNMLSLDVQGMQQRLNMVDGKKLSTNGIYDKATQKEILVFQKKNHLKVDGIMNADDLKVLDAMFKEKISKYDPQMNKAISEMKKMLNE